MHDGISVSPLKKFRYLPMYMVGRPVKQPGSPGKDAKRCGKRKVAQRFREES